MTDFLLELRSEEIPARMQARAREDLARLFAGEIARSGLAAGAIETFTTPRRLALIARDLPDATRGVSEERKGPRTTAPEAALAGFLRSTGLTREQLVERDGVWFAVIDKPGRPTSELLAEAIPALVRAFPWPKSMRWGAASSSTESLRWVRPLSGIVALFGDAIVPIEVDGIAASATTFGHRFHHPGSITIGGAHDYAEKLRACHVVVDHVEREALVRDGARAAAQAAGLTLVEDEGLVVENAALTEWPVPLLGRFDAAFLGVPREVIQLTMRTNQKYFACTDAAGALSNAFVCTANIDASDGGAAVVAGNERVLSARLADAKFFWDKDLKVPLAEQAARLSQIVFHEKLGTVADKVERVAKLARWLCESGVIPPSPSRGKGQLGEAKQGEGLAGFRTSPTDPLPPAPTREVPSPLKGEGGSLADRAELAARLCKADLVTGMVGEFPELQGIIGGHLARAQGLSDDVADAIRDHYKPVGQGDEVPTAPVTVAVALADKLDTIAGFFGTAMPPSGSKDPFALRRSAIGILALIVENKLRLSLSQALREAQRWIAESGKGLAGTDRQLLDFFADRLKVQQREAGVRHDLIDAVFALGGEDDLARLLARVRALQGFVGTTEGAALLGGYKRAANILKKEGFEPLPFRGGVGVGSVDQSQNSFSPDKPHPNPSPKGEGLAGALSYTPEPCEAALIDALDRVEPRAAAAVAQEAFDVAMASLSELRAPIDAFFEAVTVNDADPDKRTARLALLARFRDAVHRVADFSRIEG